MSTNVAVITGRLGKDAETAFTPQGVACIYLPIIDAVVQGLRAKGLPPWADADDLKSEAVLAVLKEKPDNPALARTVAAHAIGMMLRRDRLRYRTIVKIVDDAEDEDKEMTPNEWDLKEVRQSLRRTPSTHHNISQILDEVIKLPPLYRRIMLLRFRHGLTNQQLAKRFNKSEDAIKGIIKRALCQLRDTFSALAHYTQ